MRRAAAVVAATLVVLSGASVALGASVAGNGTNSASLAQDGKSDEYDAWLAPGRGGKTNPGRENDDEQQFGGNTTFMIDDHSPGASGNSFNIYATGVTENHRMFWNIVQQADFTWDECTSATDAKVFGVDRGNDDPGTHTDESLLNAYESVTYHEDGIRVKFRKEESVSGTTVNITVNDQIVSRVVNCLQNPEEPGWYRLTGYINGSTKMDPQQDYTIHGASNFVYIGDYSSREEAKQELGPPPTTCPDGFVCRTEGGEYYTAEDQPGDDSQSEGPSPTPTDSGGEETPTDSGEPTPTPTDSGGEETPTDSGEATPTEPPTEPPTDDQSTDDDQQNNDQQNNDDQQNNNQQTDGRQTTTQTGSVPVTPTIAEGPGFGPLVALGALLGGALFALRRLQ